MINEGYSYVCGECCVSYKIVTCSRVFVLKLVRQDPGGGSPWFNLPMLPGSLLPFENENQGMRLIDQRGVVDLSVTRHCTRPASSS